MIRTYSLPTASAKAALIALLVTACATVAMADDYLVYVDEDRVILQGHDPVALLTDGRLTPGDADQSSTYRGAVYRFSSADNKRKFDADPEKYAPQFGGHCAMSMAMGMLEPADVSTWSIVNGRLVVQRNEKAKKMWSMNPEGNLEKADGNWPQFVADNGKKG
jgi:YHS domain-containing protein